MDSGCRSRLNDGTCIAHAITVCTKQHVILITVVLSWYTKLLIQYSIHRFNIEHCTLQWQARYYTGQLDKCYISYNKFYKYSRVMKIIFFEMCPPPLLIQSCGAYMYLYEVQDFMFSYIYCFILNRACKKARLCCFETCDVKAVLRINWAQIWNF